jgi:hypothetical protein
MMKLTFSTPHRALKNLAKGPLTRPNNFMMIPQISRFGHPQSTDPNKFTLITPFSTDRDQWMHSKCINIHDARSPVYTLTKEHDGRSALPKTFSMLMDSYQNHPEAKSLGPDGKACQFDTRGLLQRAYRRELAADLHRERIRPCPSPELDRPDHIDFSMS